MGGERIKYGLAVALAVALVATVATDIFGADRTGEVRITGANSSITVPRNDGVFVTDPPGLPENSKIPPLNVNVTEPIDYATEIITVINEKRALHGLRPLQVHWSLRELAEVRAEEISSDFSNVRPDGTLARDTHKYSEIRTASNATPNDILNVWLDTSAYQFSVLDEGYVNAGAGYYQDESGNGYWVLLLSRK